MPPLPPPPLRPPLPPLLICCIATCCSRSCRGWRCPKWSVRSVCAEWSAVVCGECVARPARQKAELSAALAMVGEEAEAMAGARRLARLIRSVPADDWPRSGELVAALRSARTSLVPLLSSPSAAVATAAANALVAMLARANGEGSERGVRCCCSRTQYLRMHERSH